MSVLKPLTNFVLVEPIKDDTQQGGFLLPESVAEKPAKGKVISGEGFKKGDIVVYRQYKGQEFRDNGKELLFIESKDIVGIYG